ncbi:MAG: outer membrane beta-barrel protein [Xanthobacteraceae bacterium]|jgi:opacity protein-like surface antigen
MVSVKSVIAAGAAAFISTAACAADMALPPPPQLAYPVPVQASGWYLRGDIGVGMTDAFSLDYLPNPLNPPNNFAFQHSSMADTMFFNVGVGYELNNWLRFDVTGEYRAKTAVNAFGTYTYGGGAFGDAYQGNLSSWVALANGYVDLGTWWCVTPFVGAGIGGAYNTMNGLTDIGIGTSGTGIGRNSASWSPAWALYAGLTYNVTQSFKVDLTYRYLNYGSVTDTIDCTGGCNPDSYKFGNLSSQDIMLGVRFLLLPEPMPVMPLMSRG